MKEYADLFEMRFVVRPVVVSVINLNVLVEVKLVAAFVIVEVKTELNIVAELEVFVVICFVEVETVLKVGVELVVILEHQPKK